MHPCFELGEVSQEETYFILRINAMDEPDGNRNLSMNIKAQKKIPIREAKLGNRLSEVSWWWVRMLVDQGLTRFFLVLAGSLTTWEFLPQLQKAGQLFTNQHSHTSPRYCYPILPHDFAVLSTSFSSSSYALLITENLLLKKLNPTLNSNISSILLSFFWGLFLSSSPLISFYFPLPLKPPITLINLL